MIIAVVESRRRAQEATPWRHHCSWKNLLLKKYWKTYWERSPRRWTRERLFLFRHRSKTEFPKIRMYRAHCFVSALSEARFSYTPALFGANDQLPESDVPIWRGVFARPHPARREPDRRDTARPETMARNRAFELVRIRSPLPLGRYPDDNGQMAPQPDHERARGQRKRHYECHGNSDFHWNNSWKCRAQTNSRGPRY